MPIQHDLKPYFDGGTDMHLQVTPNDVYFVVPKKIGNYVFGDHYRLHHVSQMVPPYDRAKTYTNLIDIHRTNMFYDSVNAEYKPKHEPKCMFHNGSRVPIINNNLNFDSLVCFNKVQRGNHYMNRVFNDKTEYELVSKLLQMSFDDNINKRKAAANKIKLAFKARFKRGGGRKYLNIDPHDKIDYIHILYIRERPIWHITVLAYKDGEPTKHMFFTVNKLTWKNISAHLDRLFVA
jgi:hypothetical protein